MEPAETVTAQSALRSALSPHYVLERELGRGGMAVVYLARDLRHGRLVAIKVLNQDLSAALGSERFLREIALTASLQHPHILPLFDSGAVPPAANDAAGTRLLYYVMPYVEGETLRARLARDRQLPVAEAVRIATEVASALDYAHRRGVVHRDIKPENILLHDGSALVADFGVAKALSAAATSSGSVTATSVTVGTPLYMPPEQAAADRTVDARADVYALGAVLYEMLAGEPPFTGASGQAVIARVMTEDPAPLTRHRRSVPPHVEAAVMTALEKLPADRFESAGAFVAALADPAATPARTWSSAGRPRRQPPIARGLLSAGALLVGAALGWALGRTSVARTAPASGRGPVRFIIEPDSGFLGSGNWWYSAPAISPDGRTVVYAASGSGGGWLYARRVDDVAARPLPGTEGGDWPFFSPDGAWVGFTSRGVIRKVRLGGGTPVVVAELPPDSPTFFGGVWSPTDTIFYTVFARGVLYRVPAAGGTPTRIAIADTSWAILHPYPVPGRRTLLVTASRDWRVGRIGVLDLATGQLRRFGPGTGARYVGGYIVYAGAGGPLYRQPFDLDRLAPSGPAEEIASGLDVQHISAYSPLDVSPTGALVYRVSSGSVKLTITDRTGREQQVVPGLYPWTPRFSPDGRRVVFGAFAPGYESGDVWSGELWRGDILIADLASGATERLTTDGNDNNDPVWSPDGRSVAFSAGLLGGKHVFVKALGGDSARLLTNRPGQQFPTDWAPDGSAVLFRQGQRSRGEGIWLQPVDGGAARPLLPGPRSQADARVSPDGRWVAYHSDETGHNEVYLQSYPSLGRKALISAGGGRFPAWRRDGRELYYWQGEQLIAVSLEPSRDGQPPVARARTPLFRAPRVDAAGYDVSPDGTRFIFVSGGPRANRLVVALDALAAGRPPERAGH